MLGSKSPLVTLLQGMLVGYLLVSVLYTTIYSLGFPVLSAVVSVFGFGLNSVSFSPSSSPAITPRIDLIAHAHQVLEDARRSQASPDSDLSGSTSWNFDSSKDLLYWNLPAVDSLANPASGALGDELDAVPIHEETFLSKAFAQAMHPTEIISFYYKATGPVDPEDVTITTLVTSNRYKVLRQLVERYQGPISVTIHIPLPPASSADAAATSQFVSAVQDLEALYASSPHFATYVDVHLAMSPLASAPHTAAGSTEGGRQFNVWRNVARLFARTEFVMMLDVDFAVCTDWRSDVRNAVRRIRDGGAASVAGGDGLQGEIVEKLRGGTAALVIPAFEYTKQDDGVDQSTFPRDKQSLLRLASGSRPKLAMFHASWGPGHNSTDYPRYLSIAPGSQEVYKVTTYQSAYEPYVIMSKRVPWCDERFTGYGGNKAACLFEIYLSGVSFHVMSDHFLIHQSHKYEEEARREERKYNRKLYADFKEEACLRYLYRFHTAGALRAPLAANAVEECRKLKNVEKIAAELLGEAL